MRREYRSRGRLTQADTETTPPHEDLTRFVQQGTSFTFKEEAAKSYRQL